MSRQSLDLRADHRQAKPRLEVVAQRGALAALGRCLDALSNPQRSSQGHSARDIFGARAQTRLLSTTKDDRIQALHARANHRSNPSWPAQLVGSECNRHAPRQVGQVKLGTGGRLDVVDMKGHCVLGADRSDVGDWLHDTRHVACAHHTDQRVAGLHEVPEFDQVEAPIWQHRRNCDLPPTPRQHLCRASHCWVLDGTDDHPPRRSLSPAEHGQVVGLGATTRQHDVDRICTHERGDLFPRCIEVCARLPSKRVRLGGIAKAFRQVRQHRFDHAGVGRCGGCMVEVDHDRIVAPLEQLRRDSRWERRAELSHPAATHLPSNLLMQVGPPPNTTGLGWCQDRRGPIRWNIGSSADHEPRAGWNSRSLQGISDGNVFYVTNR